MIWLILPAILATSFLSGILGMGGGMILIGVLTLLLPVTSAMILHAFSQIASNGARAFFLRQHIQGRVLAPYLIGALSSYVTLSIVHFVPTKSFILVAIGIFPFIALSLPKSTSLDLMRRPDSFACGLVVTAAQIMAGAAGPVLDVFFIKSSLDKREIVATKAITQTIGHAFKMAYYAQILWLARRSGLKFPLALLPLAMACAFLGTRTGKLVLDRLSDLQFRKYSRFVIVLIGGAYIVKGLVG